jgi:hypothetical protein
MNVDGWHPDPYGIHEERLFANGEPTPLVRNQGIGSFSPLPLTESEPNVDAKATRPGPTEGAAADATSVDGADPSVESGSTKRQGAIRPTKPMVALAALLILAGVVVGVLGISGVGGNGSAETTTTQSPLVSMLRHLPPLTTVIPPQRQTEAVPTTTTPGPLESALQALPPSTSPPATTPPTTKPRTTTTTPRAAAPVVTQPAKHGPAVSSIVATTTLPLTTMTTSVGDADQQWYLAYGSVFNILQTDIEKLDRALASTAPSSYVDIHPYWQELSIDANYAISLPPIPDGGTQSAWATALGDLSEGATECILGSIGTPAGAAFTPTIFNQGAAFITTGTTQFDGAVTSVESSAAVTSVPSRSQVQAWNQAHGALVSTLQTDVTKLNAAFAATMSSDYSTVVPFWQQLSSDAQSALKSAPIPDRLIQSYWTTALDDLAQGSSDCIESSEALPPNLFDQGVSSIASGATYLTTSVGAIQSLVG